MPEVLVMSKASLFFVDSGAGEPVVLLHAFPLDGRMWEMQARELAKRARVVVPDLRGFGRSKAAPPSSIEQMADDVVALLDTLAIAHATIVGLSMGGYVAMALTRRHPTRVARLGLCDTRAEPDSSESRKTRDVNIALVDREGVAPLVEKMLPVLLSPEASAGMKDHVRGIGNSQSRDGVKGALASMRDRHDAGPWLPSFDAPSLVIVGAEDTLSPPSCANAIADKLPHAELEVIPGAGHLANLEKPSAFTGALYRLLDRAR
jgi:3-oxoadipate enol-lactonase